MATSTHGHFLGRFQSLEAHISGFYSFFDQLFLPSVKKLDEILINSLLFSVTGIKKNLKGITQW